MKITAWLPASIFFLGIFIHALVYIIPANTDLVDGRHSLHMDERITFDQTYEIVSSASPKALITNFVGNDFRYGRLTFAFPAAISWLPFSFFGDKGLIIGNRTFFYLVVLSVSFFVFFFAGINFLGALGGLAVLTAPYSDYYSTMPKPDAVQVLCILLCFSLACSRRHYLSALMAGLAVGLKVIGVLILPVLAVYYLQLTLKNFQSSANALRLSALRFGTWSTFFLLGLITNVPILLQYPQGWKLYQLSILSNASHGADTFGPYWDNWLLNMKYLLGGPQYIFLFGVLLVVTVSLAILDQSHRSLKLTQKEIEARQSFKNKLSFFSILAKNFFLSPLPLSSLLAVLGTGWLIGVVVFIPRVWGIYLWPPIIFIIVSGVLAARQLNLNHRGIIIAYSTVMILCAGITFLLPFGKFSQSLIDLSQRTNTEEYKKLKRQHQQVLNYLGSLDKSNHHLIHFDPRLFQPTSNNNFKIENYWGPYHHWNQKPHAIINLPDSFLTFEKPATAYEKEMNDVAPLAASNLSPPFGSCVGMGCYKLITSSADLNIWERVD